MQQSHLAGYHRRQQSTATEATMNQPLSSKNSIKHAAQSRRRAYLTDLATATFVAITDELRRQHEAWLRHAAGRRARFQNRIGTPV
jgi:hypothetical protein